ncbi:hypothetical protein [Fictibacillus barbaricus]|uniref:HTH cro/C1-type domain-containing protein n=1 Tax=Fictibacillus barbaricus TaxID=182136 RepID=A0ABS2ZCB2_9BACL|nr:hypothetical protein [Fictibacillus barbaricus]MBN3544385.1 hypothetical protein [Fictibacillus barbaricus]GGB67258.1 hypothetical protein GCM10007199_36790 [Fictibacillus barbaricus]
MLDQNILLKLEAFIQEHLLLEIQICQSPRWMEEDIQEQSIHFELDHYINKNRKQTLQQKLFQLIDQKGLSDAEVYRKAGIDRKHFSKIRSIGYRPKKNTILALALALELSEEDTDELLGSAGFSLSNSDTNDLIFKFCLTNKIYDVYQVNEYLEYFSLKSTT